MDEMMDTAATSDSFDLPVTEAIDISELLASQ